MMGQQNRTESLFYYFRLEEPIPADHLLRMIDGHVDLILPTSVPYVRAQANAPYTDTTVDFQRFLQDILDATKKGDKLRVESLLKNTEVPNYDAWLHQMYKSDSADSWMSLCDSKTLRSQEKSMEELFARFAKEGGEFSTRKVNDNPLGGEGGLESGMVHGLKRTAGSVFCLVEVSKPTERG